MKHKLAGRKLNRTSSHRKALLRNLATQLLEHKRIQTTEAKAKTLRPYVEKLITRAKRAIAREQEGRLPQGQTVDVHARRLIGKDIRTKSVLEELFEEIAPKIGDRPGGYTRIVKTYIKRGDSGKMALIELVDYNMEQSGTKSTGKKKKKSDPTIAKTEKVDVEKVADAVGATAIVADTVDAITEDKATETEVSSENASSDSTDTSDDS